ncbi:vWA domain-containing protein [Kurthia senegalensis]|uniref:vWA domain-containing protein n=1 Tax=Kurthia senegalensis TaxID=1033740 RepID=UPI000287E803|nr:inner membrane protein [Kurthia senegalensis]
MEQKQRGATPFDRVCQQFSPLQQQVTHPVYGECVRDLWHHLWSHQPISSFLELAAYEEVAQKCEQDIFWTTLTTWCCTEQWIRTFGEEEQPFATHTKNEERVHVFEQIFQQIALLDEAVDHFLRGIGPNVDGGDRQRVSVYDQLRLAKALHDRPSLVEIATWAARFKVTARLTKKAMNVPTILKRGIRLGHAAERLVPAEYLKSDDADAQLDFMRRLSEGRATMYDYKMKKKEAKGAFVVCFDESSSMQALDLQGKGFLVALMALAKKERRDFIFIPFSGDVGHSDVRVFKKGRYTIKDLVDVATSYIGGGTNFEAPLKEAMRHLEQSTKNGHVLFITDGVCHIPESFITEFNTLKRKKAFELVTLLIGYDQHPGLLPEISDELRHIAHFEDEAGSIAFTL